VILTSEELRTLIKRHEEAKRKRLLSKAEVEAIRERSNPRLQCVIDILVLTAQRIGDVLSIHRSDIGPHNDTITFVQRKTGVKIMVQNAELVPVIERAKTLYGNVRAMTLFHTRKGTKPSLKCLTRKE
jgi:integrase